MRRDDLAESRKQLEGNIREHFDLMLKAFEGESDRSTGIVSICILDKQLENLIRSCLIKDPQVNSLFKDEHILQTFHAKTNLAYFFGLIPKWLYHDLKTLGKIRNRFAHEAVCDLHFSAPAILKLINQCKVRLKILDGILSDPKAQTHVIMARAQYTLIASRIVTYIGWCEDYLARCPLSRPIEFLEFDERKVDEQALAKSEFLAALSKGSSHKAE